MAPHTGSHFLCGSSACIRAVPYARDGTSVNRLTSVVSRSTNYGIVEIPPFSVLWCHGPQRVMWDGTAQTAKMSCRPAVLRDSTKKRLLLFSWVVGRVARPTDDVEPVGRAFGDPVGGPRGASRRPVRLAGSRSPDRASDARRRPGHVRGTSFRIGSIGAYPHVDAPGSRARVRNAAANP